jgi:serpin B
MLVSTGDGYLLVSIPYAGDASMVVVLPDPSRFDEVATRLGPAELERALGSAQPLDVSLTMPRFEFRTELELSGLLGDLGMHTAFTDAADFSGMTGDRRLSIGAVIHQAFIKVDEEGTEAAAATAVVMRVTAAIEPAVVTLDRPFLFVIQHDGTGEVLFVGQVTDPS